MTETGRRRSFIKKRFHSFNTCTESKNSSFLLTGHHLNLALTFGLLSRIFFTRLNYSFFHPVAFGKILICSTDAEFFNRIIKP